MAPGDPDSSICKPDGKWSGIIGEGREARFEVIFKTEFIWIKSGHSDTKDVCRDVKGGKNDFAYSK